MSQAAETVDVLIVGAGLSGVGAASQLRQECPDKSVMVLEARDAIGGTWDLFRYPGIRSDSDMFTLGYRFQPWTDAKAIADGPSILRYIHDTARAFDVDKLIRLNHRVVNANWDSDEARWTVEVHRTDTDEMVTIVCSFLYVCTGYYRYDEGFSPKFPGVERFQRAGDPPAALAGGPRLPRQAGGRDRQRCDCGDARAHAGRIGRTCDDAAALADLCRVAPRQ